MTKQIQIRSYGILFFTLWTTPWAASYSWASSQVATLTQAEGDVKIFSHPSKTLPDTQSDAGTHRALFEGEYFLVKDGKIGDLVDKGNIVRTTPGSKARVVYENGDQINVGPGTAYRISWNEGKDQTDVRLNLAYGKLRGIIEKGGPRSHLQIKTRTAVMGVRGTDFFISQGITSEVTEVSIIRGTVDVTPTGEGAKKAKVEAGYSAEIKTAVQPTAEIRKTTQDELITIQDASSVDRGKSQAPGTSEIKDQVKKLEQKASQTALKDIQLQDQGLYSTLTPQSKDESNLDELNNAAIGNLLKNAPHGPKKSKPHTEELEDSKDGAYDKYFKNVQ